MQDQRNDAVSRRRRRALVDNRSLLGAVALNITGWILAFMLYQYLEPADGTTGLSRSRLVWEIILNLQILSAAFVWFCYSDRIEGSKGQIRHLQVARLWFAMITVLLPTLVGFLGIQQNWFIEPPSAATVQIFAIVVFVYWLLGVWLNSLVYRKRKTKLPPASLLYRTLFLSPTIMLLLVVIVDLPAGGQIWLLAIPALTYMQGSMPYITRAFGIR